MLFVSAATLPSGKSFYGSGDSSVTDFTCTGVVGLSSLVGTFDIFSTISYPLTIFPKTGCCDSVDLSNQSRKLLFATLIKNCDPPLLGAPVLAILNVPGSFEICCKNSSGMQPSLSRVTVLPCSFPDRI